MCKDTLGCQHQGMDFCFINLDGFNASIKDW
jgi:hypothetical protein